MESGRDEPRAERGGLVPDPGLTVAERAAMLGQSARRHTVEQRGYGIELKPREKPAYWAQFSPGVFTWEDRLAAMLKAESLSCLAWVEWTRVTRIRVLVVEE